MESRIHWLDVIRPGHVRPRIRKITRWIRSAAGKLDTRGVLLMEFLPGRPLRYETDAPVAADIFSKIHRIPVSEKLVVQKNPILDIAGESYALINRFADHPLEKEKKMLGNYHDVIHRLGEEKGPAFENENMCVVNTEVNSHNFLITKDSGFLVDWEKAVISYRYQDLGHFLVPTTTLWKTDYVYSKEEKKSFLVRYRENMNLDVPVDELVEKTALLERTILLRGLSWCIMAFYEYTQTDRPLSNPDTFSKIKQYLDNIDWFLNL